MTNELDDMVLHGLVHTVTQIQRRLLILDHFIHGKSNCRKVVWSKCPGNIFLEHVWSCVLLREKFSTILHGQAKKELSWASELHGQAKKHSPQGQYIKTHTTDTGNHLTKQTMTKEARRNLHIWRCRGNSASNLMLRNQMLCGLFICVISNWLDLV
jgi:hypothetical protein